MRPRACDTKGETSRLTRALTTPRWGRGPFHDSGALAACPVGQISGTGCRSGALDRCKARTRAAASLAVPRAAAPPKATSHGRRASSRQAEVRENPRRRRMSRRRVVDFRSAVLAGSAISRRPCREACAVGVHAPVRPRAPAEVAAHSAGAQGVGPARSGAIHARRLPCAGSNLARFHGERPVAAWRRDKGGNARRRARHSAERPS
jgi:hypothetical protein